MFIDTYSVPSLSRIEDFAVNVDYVKDFLKHFQQSPMLQLFILNHYRAYMIKERDAVLKDIEENKEKKPG